MALTGAVAIHYSGMIAVAIRPGGT